MILLNFEKAYDRIEWCFFIGMLKDFGFPKKYYDWISILFNEASIVIDVNGYLLEPIRLQSSIRQGCLIAPLLFVIVADVMFYVLRAS